MKNTEEITRNRNTLLKFLKGEISEEKNPAFFQDDIFFLLVRDMENQDYKWLAEQIKSPAFKKELRGVVVMNLTGERQQDFLKLVF
jgi:hypothetical protein